VDAEGIARELSAARESATLIEPPSARVPGFSWHDGYAVGRKLHEMRVASGATPVGLKLGFTNQAVWERLGLDRPFWSPIYQETLRHPGPAALDGLAAPRIEPEIVLGFGHDLAPGASAEEVGDAVVWAALGFEIVQCHFPGWRLTPPDAIADAGLHGFLVMGERVSVTPAEAKALASVAVELYRNGVAVAQGQGANALGGPVAAVTWLLSLSEAPAVPAGAIITTGTLTAALEASAGETWTLDSTGSVPLGALDVALV
jgi:2-oxo-3-hexenedioate decarboxylase